MKMWMEMDENVDENGGKWVKVDENVHAATCISNAVFHPYKIIMNDNE